MEKLLPKLRFPGFEGEWEKIENTINIISGNSYALSDYKENGIILIQGLNINPGKLDIEKSYFIDENNNKKHVRISYGDILLGLNRPVTSGKLKVCRYNLQNEGFLYQRAGKLKFDFNQIYPDFLYQYLRSDFFLKSILNELVGSDQPYIRSNLFEIVEKTFPSLPEQTKIATFLTEVDKKLTAFKQKKTLLEQYKKGVMQQIFSQQLRFKDDNGNDFPDWEEKKLGEVASLLKDGSHASHKDVESNYYLLSAKNIKNGHIKIDSEDRKISETDYNSIYKNYNLKVDDILLTIVGTIGRVAKYIGESNVAFQRSVAIFRFDNILSDYIYHFMNGDYFQRELDTRKVISAQPGIYLGDLSKIVLHIPSLPEQTKIANFLSAIDEKINHCQGQIEKTQVWKKGLLQQLFV